MERDDEIRRKLEYLKALELRYRDELSRSRVGRMVRIPSSDENWNYMEVTKMESGYLRKGITKNLQAVYAHARKRFLQDMVKRLEKNIMALERFQKTYREIDAGEIIDSLPHTYHNLPLEAFFPSDDRSGWEREDYPKNLSFPEHLRHVTLKGFKVRSKSELYIASQLDQYGLPFRYEMEIQLGSKCYYPDFVLRNPHSGELTYWEHCGMVGDERYMTAHYEKMKIYGKHGIVPWKNLIVTYDDEDGNINAQDIDQTIRSIITAMGRKLK